MPLRSASETTAGSGTAVDDKSIVLGTANDPELAVAESLAVEVALKAARLDVVVVVPPPAAVMVSRNVERPVWNVWYVGKLVCSVVWTSVNVPTLEFRRSIMLLIRVVIRSRRLAGMDVLDSYCVSKSLKYEMSSLTKVMRSPMCEMP